MRFRSDPKQIRGSIAPIVTAFAEDGSLDLGTIARLIEWHVDSGTHGISVGGTTGEPASQTVEEREAVMETAAQTIAERVPFVPGSGSTNLAETLRLTATAESLGADAVLLIVPYYNRPSQEGLYRWFSTIASEFPNLPLILYNIPARTAVNLEPPTLARLRRAHENIVGVKEANKDFEHVSKVLFECGRDFLVYSGIELLCYPMLAIGGAGHISATANVLPTEVAEVYNLVTAGRWEEAIDLHYELLPLNEALFLETNPGPLKWAMARLGLIPSGTVRLPLAPPSDATQARIQDALDRYPQAARQMVRG
jgi:4-hydroxy-tetrahydrodipicolinate synthase